MFLTEALFHGWQRELQNIRPILLCYLDEILYNIEYQHRAVAYMYVTTLKIGLSFRIELAFF